MCDKDEAVGLDIHRWVPINFVPGIVHRGEHSHNVNLSASLHSRRYTPARRGVSSWSHSVLRPAEPRPPRSHMNRWLSLSILFSALRPFALRSSPPTCARREYCHV